MNTNRHECKKRLPTNHAKKFWLLIVIPLFASVRACRAVACEGWVIRGQIFSSSCLFVFTCPAVASREGGFVVRLLPQRPRPASRTDAEFRLLHRSDFRRSARLPRG